MRNSHFYILTTISMFDSKKVAKTDAICKAMVTDLAGNLKEIIFPIAKIEELVSTGIAYDGSSFQGINVINSSDAILLGVPESLVKCPAKLQDTEKEEYRIICSILATDGTPHPHCARNKLVAMQQELAKKRDGGIFYVGAEPESFFVEKKE